MLVLAVLSGSAILYMARAQGQVAEKTPLSRWRSRDYAGIRYLGSDKCAECHSFQTGTQLATPMAHAMENPADSRILASHQELAFRNGPYSYLITRQGNRSIYTVADGAKSISEPILYCFGQGLAGQTYVFKHGDVFYESRVSYFKDLQNLDITILHPRSVPASLVDALGRPMSREAAEGCFGCHSTSTLAGPGIQLDHLVPGVTCERCHGPGEKHVAAIKAGKIRDPQIFNPGKLDTIDQMQEFCGSCHQNFETVMLMPAEGGIGNIRFQPYRLFKSRGHFSDDPRIGCVTCHDPHNDIKRETGFYDARCLACHLASSQETPNNGRNAPACPVSKRDCVSCHMPKVEMAEMHFKFTDHWIRVVKPNSPVPR